MMLHVFMLQKYADGGCGDIFLTKDCSRRLIFAGY
jgi:hypothetical protein